MDETKIETTEGSAGTEVTGTGNQEGQERTYSEKEFQSEVDKRVTDALKTAKTKWQSEYEAKLEAEKDEAARLAKMSAEEREKVQSEKRQKEFDDERAKFNAERLEFECTKLLAADNLPVEFSSMLTGTDADTTKKNIETFKGAFNKAIEAAVTERLKGKPPKMSSDPDKKTDPFLSGFGM